MKKYLGLIKYLKPYKKNILLYIFFILMAIIFGLFSLAMLFPFFELIFKGGSLLLVKPTYSLSSEYLTGTMKFWLSNFIILYGKTAALAIVCGFIIISTLLKNVFVYFSYYVMSPMRNGMMVQIRKDLFNKILTLPIGFFTEQRKGDLISRMTNDTWELESSVANTLDGLIKEPLTVIAYLATLVFLSPQLSLIIFILLPFAGFVIGRVSKSLKKDSNAAAIKSGESLSLLEETLGGIRIIKAFTAETLVREKFNVINDGLFNVRNKMNFRRDLASPLSEFLGILVFCAILWFGGKLILESKSMGLDGASFILYIGIFAQIINPAKSLSTAFYNMQRGTSAIQRIEEIINTENSIVEIPNALPLEDFNDCIEFKNVNFSYNQVPILKNINLKVKKGQTIALVGSSGSGKSTLADLIPRFHDVTSGEILIDGINVKNIQLNSIRNKISIVTQEAVLFNDTIANNIALGKENATITEITNAATVANAIHFINKKENQLQENVGDRGSKLSGGERQRVTIARAVLKNAPILILDEATSALDTESERLVQDAIENMLQNRTTIVIAHRLSTIRNAHEIIVLQKGEIIERGNHDALIKLGGTYKKLIDMQEVR